MIIFGFPVGKKYRSVFHRLRLCLQTRVEPLRCGPIDQLAFQTTEVHGFIWQRHRFEVIFDNLNPEYYIPIFIWPGLIVNLHRPVRDNAVYIEDVKEITRKNVFENQIYD